MREGVHYKVVRKHGAVYRFLIAVLCVKTSSTL